jgi:hypothetical protein
VRDEDHRLLVALPEAQQLDLHQLAGLRVERAEGLVHEEDRRLDDQCPSEVRALAHSARELVRVAFGELLQAGQAQELFDGRLHCVLVTLSQLNPEDDVLLDRAPGQQ